jgi:predicted small secreted protein
VDGFLTKAAVTRSDTEQCLSCGATVCIEHLTRRYTMFKRILAALMLLGMLGTIAGCNTMQGLGADIERGGEKIQDKAAR